MPTLVIHGTEDRLLPVANGRLIASLIPGARLEILDGVGHLFFWERPERSAELVRAHAAVARLSAGPPRRRAAHGRARAADVAGEGGVALSGEQRGQGSRSCSCTASPRRAATW